MEESTVHKGKAQNFSDTQLWIQALKLEIILFFMYNK